MSGLHQRARFRDRMRSAGMRQSTNVEDRRPAFTGKAARGSAGYGWHSPEFADPNLSEAVPVWPADDETTVPRNKMLLDRYRATPPEPMEPLGPTKQLDRLQPQRRKREVNLPKLYER